MNRFGHVPYEECPICSRCHSVMDPIWFREYEEKVYQGELRRTGRSRLLLSHFECPNCFRKEAVDDTYDGEWEGPLSLGEDLRKEVLR